MHVFLKFRQSSHWQVGVSLHKSQNFQTPSELYHVCVCAVNAPLFLLTLLVVIVTGGDSSGCGGAYRAGTSHRPYYGDGYRAGESPASTIYGRARPIHVKPCGYTESSIPRISQQIHSRGEGCGVWWCAALLPLGRPSSCIPYLLWALLFFSPKSAMVFWKDVCFFY